MFEHLHIGADLPPLSEEAKRLEQTAREYLKDNPKQAGRVESYVATALADRLKVDTEFPDMRDMYRESAATRFELLGLPQELCRQLADAIFSPPPPAR